MRIAVLMGGINTERDVSIASGVAVAAALRKAGHAVAIVDSALPVTDEVAFTDEQAADQPAAVKLEPPSMGELERLRRNRAGEVFAAGVLDVCRAAEITYILLYGDEGESGHAQSVLDLAGLPYTGPGPLACALSFDKDITKRLTRDAGITTAPWRVLHRGDADAVADLDVPGPWVVKPVRGGSTIGVSLAHTVEELHDAVSTALYYSSEALVEQFLPGREFTVALVGEEALPVLEVRPEAALFDYIGKYQGQAVEELCPAPIPDLERDRLHSLALAINDVLRMGQRSTARVDFRTTDDGDYACLEVNGLPGMTPTSLYPQAAAAAGMDLPALCDRIVDLAVRSAR